MKVRDKLQAGIKPVMGEGVVVLVETAMIRLQRIYNF
jgi:hypothetical protein